MSGFSKYLKRYLEEREITAAELAQEMQMDRSTVFRYTTGTRAPSDIDIVRKIANALQMQNSDKIRLLEEYDRATLGEKTVNSYQYVRKLLGNLKNVTEKVCLDVGKWKQAAALLGTEGNICPALNLELLKKIFTPMRGRYAPRQMRKRVEIRLLRAARLLNQIYQIQGNRAGRSQSQKQSALLRRIPQRIHQLEQNLQINQKKPCTK